MKSTRSVYGGGPPNRAEPSPSQLPTHEEALKAFDLRTVPPPRTFLVSDIIPAGVVGLVVAPGGTGKSFVLASLAVAVATAGDFMGHKVPMKKKVLFLSAEDDAQELHRRFRAILNDSDPMDGPAGQESAILQLESGLYVVPLVGTDNRLCILENGSLEQSNFLHNLLEWCSPISDLGLVVIDPLSRFFGGIENSAEDGTRFVECLERVRVATGATVLAVHHANKSGMRNGDDSQAAARGTSAFTDGVRWQAQLRAMSKKEETESKLKADSRKDYVRLIVTKMNYGPIPKDLWLERRAGGVLRHVSLQSAVQEKLNELEARVIEQVLADNTASRFLTKTAFVAKHGGATGKLRIAQKALRKILAKLLIEGRLVLIPLPRGRGPSLQTLAVAR